MTRAEPIRSGSHRDTLAGKVKQMAERGVNDPLIARRLSLTVQQVRSLRREYHIPAGQQRLLPGNQRAPEGEPTMDSRVTEISIDDRPILAAGYPGEDIPDALGVWHGAMIREVVRLLGDVHTDTEQRAFTGGVDWAYVAMALTVLADYIEHVHVPAANTPEGWTDDLPEDLQPIYLRGCPDDEFPGADRKRTTWAHAMTLAAIGILPENQRGEKDTIVAALSSLVRYIRSDKGPLAWTSMRPFGAS